MLWNEPKAPDFVLEVTSKSTRGDDDRRKRAVYAALGVSEYFLYDPRAEYLAPPLQGFRLHEGEYRALPAVTVLSNRGVAVASEVLGLELRDERGERRVRLRDPATGENLLTHEESERPGRKPNGPRSKPNGPWRRRPLPAGRRRRGPPSWRPACGRWKARRSRPARRSAVGRISRRRNPTSSAPNPCFMSDYAALIRPTGLLRNTASKWRTARRRATDAPLPHGPVRMRPERKDWRSLGDSNPCPRRERAVSWATRRRERGPTGVDSPDGLLLYVPSGTTQLRTCRTHNHAHHQNLPGSIAPSLNPSSSPRRSMASPTPTSAGAPSRFSKR